MTRAEPFTVSVGVPAITPFPSVTAIETDPEKVSTGLPEESRISTTVSSVKT